MPHYRIELADGIRLTDPVGLNCESEDDAKAKARFIARQIASDSINSKARFVIVKNDDGEEIYKASMNPRRGDAAGKSHAVLESAWRPRSLMWAYLKSYRLCSCLNG